MIMPTVTYISYYKLSNFIYLFVFMLQRFPEFKKTYPLNCTITEGDVLYMPAFWWHEVYSLPNEEEKRNLAINFWYVSNYDI